MKIYNEEVDSKERSFGLDILRTMAVSFIVLIHLPGFIFANSEPARIFFGYFGVELFFVLSGFLIGGILIKTISESEKFQFKQVRHFWIRRWFRTLPNYYLVLIVLVVLYSVFYYHRFILKELSFLSYFVFLQNSVSLNPGFFLVAWSLSIEEWFYLLFPLMLLLISKFSKNKKKTLLISTGVFIAFFTALRIIVAITNPALDWGSFQRIMPLRLDGIVVGVFAVIIYHYHPDFWNRSKIKSFLIGLAFLSLLITYFFLNILSENPSFFSKTFFFNAVGMSIAFLFPVINGIKRFKMNSVARFITHISLISYSVYLIHAYVISFIDKFFPISESFKVPIMLVLIFSASTLQYRLFEKPMTSLRDRFNGKKKTVNNSLIYQSALFK